MSSTQRIANKKIVQSYPCLVCQKYGVDPAHWPVRRSHLAGWGLLEVIPLCRSHHRSLDNYEGSWPSIIGELGSEFHQRMYLCYNGTKVYLGPEERVEEVSRDRSTD